MKGSGCQGVTNNWLKGEAGIAYRKHLAEMAYDSLPATITYLNKVNHRA